MTSLHRYFLGHCIDDWSGPWELVSQIRLSDPDADDKKVQARTLTVLSDLLKAGYIQAGDVDFGTGKFTSWPMSVDQVTGRIQQEWDALGRDPKPWEIVWFISTQEGDLALAEGQERNTFQEHAAEQKKNNDSGD